MRGRSLLRASVFVGCVLLVGCTLADSSDQGEAEGATSPIEVGAATSPIEVEVRGTLDSYYQALSARDWPRFENHFWPGATMTTIWAPPGETAPRVVANTIPEFVAQAPLGPGSREIFEETLIAAEITVEGNLAQAWVRYRARFGDPGDIAEWEGVDAFTLLKHEGEWRVSSLSYVPD